jgi:hypothetical protein
MANQGDSSSTSTARFGLPIAALEVALPDDLVGTHVRNPDRRAAGGPGPRGHQRRPARPRRYADFLQLVLALVATSVASYLYGLKKATDNTDTASTPRFTQDAETARKARITNTLGERAVH